MLTAGDVVHLNQGPYTLRAPIGGSAYGLVWRASGPQPGQEVALKLINQERMLQAPSELRGHWIDSAVKEAGFLRSLAPWDERNIVRLLDDGEHEGMPVLALELMSTDLGKLMPALKLRRDNRSFSRSLDWLAQINQALAKVHQYGWRYLDLKPANLLLSDDMQTLKLADFGANRVLTDEAVHAYAGTASWQAPEQFFPTEEGELGLLYATDARSDYFALGAMFYFLVTGGMPLRFCSLCGQAFHEHNVWGAKILRARNGGAAPVTLYPDEQKLFMRLIDAELHAGPPAQTQAQDGTWCPQDEMAASAPAYTPSTCAKAALALLRSLLAYAPENRPQNSIEISKNIEAIRQTATVQPKLVGRVAAQLIPVPATPPAPVCAEPSDAARTHPASEIVHALLIMIGCMVLLTILVWPTKMAFTYMAMLATY
jgi:serine/threonine-protein kinase